MIRAILIVHTPPGIGSHAGRRANAACLGKSAVRTPFPAASMMWNA